MTNLHSIAQALLAKGLSIVPVSGKRPYKRWQRYTKELPTKQELAEMFSQATAGHSPTGLAVVLGEATWRAHPYLYVVEVEERNREVAEPWLDKQLADWRHGLLVESGGGSLHIYLKSPAPVATRKHAWGEVRGAGSITVLPPSRHPDTDRLYTWLSKGEALVIDPATLLLPGLADTGKAYEALVAGAVHQGEGRNIALTSLGGVLRQKGFDSQFIEATLLSINNMSCSPPLDVREVAAIVRSVSRYKPGSQTNAQAQVPGTGVILDLSQGRILLSEVKPAKVQHLWPGWIPQAKAGELLGDPGLGKGTMLCDLAARITRHLPMPGDELCELPGPMGVVWYSAEDALDDTLVPRLLAAGADLTRIVARQFVPEGENGERLPDLSRDLAYLEADIKSVGAALVVLDPVIAFFPQSADSHKDQAVRAVMNPLGQVAERTGATIVAVRHLNKSSGSGAIYRGGGSVAFTAGARFSLVVGKDPADETGERRVLAVNKSNTYKEATAMAYRLVNTPEYEVGKVEWLGAADLTASSLLATSTAPPSGEELSKVAEAMQHLEALLSEGPQRTTQVVSSLKALAISESTLDRAKRKLGVVSQRVGGLGPDGYWTLALLSTPTAAIAKQGSQKDDGTVASEVGSCDKSSGENNRDGQGDAAKGVISPKGINTTPLTPLGEAGALSSTAAIAGNGNGQVDQECDQPLPSQFGDEPVLVYCPTKNRWCADCLKPCLGAMPHIVTVGE
jgi:hypothetical protein